MTPRRRTDGDRARRPFSDPLEPFNQRSRQPSRSQRGLEDSTRREQATRHVSRLSAEHDAPPERRWAIYGVLTVGITLVVWRLTHWIVWAYDPSGAVRTSRQPRPPEPRGLCPQRSRSSRLRPGESTGAGGLDRPGWPNRWSRRRPRHHLGLRPLLPKPVSTHAHPDACHCDSRQPRGCYGSHPAFRKS